jgi:glutamine synthetase
MHPQRFQALQKALQSSLTTPRSTKKVIPTSSLKNFSSSQRNPKSSNQISNYFGQNCFGLTEMKKSLPKFLYLQFLQSLEQGQKISLEIAEAIALAAKEWAVTRGATHFCHWFQPLTGLTAEKHDAFISFTSSEGILSSSDVKVMEHFSGSQLIQGEPDASSFPNGGMRSTFEARGYTAWDPSSPLFILEDGQTKTLCIPSVFFGYHGQSLDMKTPLLRSTEVLSEKASTFLRLLGEDTKKVSCTLGIEQEYFLVDRYQASLRPDLYMTGRTLLGAKADRGQQFEDHYFGAIPTRVKNFMAEVEEELYTLGIPIKTRHNEVAPSQFEVAPIFEDINLAIDHNLLTMETLRRVAKKHGLLCLIHEKPFAGVNGSGKHCNWSMINDKGENLLEPGQTPHENLRFLAILSVILRAVYEHADLLRASIASAGNDHRLGANEAPPAIVSVFLGGLLDDILESIALNKTLKATAKEIINLGISKIPDISKDYTDRNRTSPFAFTGNKFEFRAVGSSANPSYPMMILNAAVADAFDKSIQELGTLQDSYGILNFIRHSITQTQAIRFSGNGYSKEWKKEAKKRHLPLAENSVQAFSFLKEPHRREFLISTGVLSQDEVESHYHIFLEKYTKSLELESKVLLDLAQSMVIPCLEQHYLKQHQLQKLSRTPDLKKILESKCSSIEMTLVQLHHSCTTLSQKLNTLLDESHDDSHDPLKKGLYIEKEILPELETLRSLCDSVELMVPDQSWSLPKYRELLMTVSK